MNQTWCKGYAYCMKLYSKRYTSIGGMVIFKMRLNNKPAHYWKTRGHVAVLSSSFSTCFILQNCSFLHENHQMGHKRRQSGEESVPSPALNTTTSKRRGSESSPSLQCTVKVTGLQANTSEDLLMNYLASRTSDDLTVVQSPVSS